MIHVLIVDDHAVLRQGLKMLFDISPDIELAGEAADGDGLMQLLRSEAKYDVLLADMSMPGISGISLIEHIKACRKDLPILIFSMHNDPQMIMRAFRAGVAGYIAKDKAPEILLEAIRKVARGGKYIDPKFAEQMALDGLSNTQCEPHAKLTNRELEVFSLLVAGNRINDIAHLMAISNKTVSSHKKTLMQKMNLSSMAELIRYSVQYRLFEDNL